jgi:FixJ family two-component response regulator
MPNEVGDRAVVHIIDDDESLRRALDRVFRSVGLVARTYGTAREFIDAPRPDLPACNVLDVRLPGINGLEFQSQLSELGIRLPVILITGHGDIPMTVRAMKAGAVDFLPKPFRDQDILDAVTTAIDRDRQRRAAHDDTGAVKARFATLSPREQQVMKLVTAGKMNKQVAGELGLSEVTVKIHRAAAMRKMGARTLAEVTSHCASELNKSSRTRWSRTRLRKADGVELRQPRKPDCKDRRLMPRWAATSEMVMGASALSAMKRSAWRTRPGTGVGTVNATSSMKWWGCWCSNMVRRNSSKAALAAGESAKRFPAFDRRKIRDHCQARSRSSKKGRKAKRSGCASGRPSQRAHCSSSFSVSSGSESCTHCGSNQSCVSKLAEKGIVWPRRHSTVLPSCAAAAEPRVQCIIRKRENPVSILTFAA